MDEIDTAQFHRAISAAYNQQRDAGVSTWYTVPYLPETGRMTEDQRPVAQGDVYDLNITCTLSGDSLGIREELNAMRERRFLVRITRGSLVLLLGTPEVPMRFGSKFDTGAAGGDSREHKLSFTGVSTQKLPGYVPIF